MTEQKDKTAVKPKYKVIEGEGKVTFAVALPGVNKDQVSVKAEEGIVILSAERANVSHESWSLIGGSPEPELYELRLRVGSDYDLEKTEAKFEKNVLRLSVPVKESKQLALEVQ